MNEMMTFPNTWEEFEKSYGFTDNEEVYTNGARLIPSFRVKQWLDHLLSEEPQKWIPVFERLPEEGTDVLGTDRNGCIRHVYKDKTGLYEFATVEEGMHIGIVAWMPLPEPWGGDSYEVD